MAFNNSSFPSDWSSTAIVDDVLFHFSFFPSSSATNVSGGANFLAHVVTKWATSHQCYGSILISLAFLSSVRIKSGKNPL